MGGSFKGGSGTGGGNRGRSYGMILLLAFGAAIFGVMALHKLRERRIFNLLIKEKDQELLSLQLLLQKERDLTKEMRSKTEEMKANIYSLKSQKMELNSRVLEMQSTISSLKDEQRTMESALQEKQSEIKMMRGKEMDAEKDCSQVTVLTDFEAKGSRNSTIEKPNKAGDRIWSVSSDNPSNPSLHSTTSEFLTQKDNIENRSNNDENEKGVIRGGIRKEIVGGEKKINQESENGRGFGGEKKNRTTETEATNTNARNDKKTMRDKEDEANNDELQQKIATSENGGGQTTGLVSRGGMKMERAEYSQLGISSKGRGHRYLSRTKGQRWRMITKRRELEHIASMRNRRNSQGDSKRNDSEKSEADGGFRISKADQQRLLVGEEATANERTREGRENGKEDNLIEVQGTNNSSETRLPKPRNVEDVKDVRKNLQQVEENHSVEKEQERAPLDNNAGNSKKKANTADEDDELTGENIRQNPKEDADDSDIAEKFGIDMDEVKEEYKEETDESEF